MEVDEETIQKWIMCDFESRNSIERKTDLTIFLSELNKVVQNLEPREVLAKFPSVPKLLQKLLNYPIIQTTETLHGLVLECVTGLAVSAQQENEITTKSVKWVKSKLKNLCTSNPEAIAPMIGFAETYGLQPIQLTKEINDELVSTCVKDLTNLPSRHWEKCNSEFVPVCPIGGTVLQDICHSCMLIMPNLQSRPLVEALLKCHLGSDILAKTVSKGDCDIVVEAALSRRFLENLRDDPKKWYMGIVTDIPLSYEARRSLWLSYPKFFENELLDLLEIFCKEKAFVTFDDMRSIVSIRSLPDALVESLTLFSMAFILIQHAIRKTKGDVHIMRFWSCLLDSMNKSVRQKQQTGSLCVNYAVVWGTRLSDLINTINIDWLDLPREAFLYRVRTVEYSMDEMCHLECRCDSYHIWLVLQGFPDLFHLSTWAILTDIDEASQKSCLTILLWRTMGGVKPGKIFLNRMQDFVQTLRISVKETNVNFNHLLDGLDSTFNTTPPTTWNLIRSIFLVFVADSPEIWTFDVQDISSKLVKDLPSHLAADFMLRWLEESSSLTEKINNRWLCDKLAISPRCYEVIQKVYKIFESKYEHQATIPRNIQCSIDTLRQRYDRIFGPARVF